MQGGPSRQDLDFDRDRRMKSDIRGRDYGRGGDLGGPPSMGSINKYGNTFGLSTVFLESLGITGPLVSKVFVANVSNRMLALLYCVYVGYYNYRISL